MADESLHDYVEDSAIRDQGWILQYIPLGPHHDRLATYHLSRREMAARDTHVSCASRGDDDNLTGCRHHPWPLYPWPSSHWHLCVRCGGVVRGVARCHPTHRCYQRSHYLLAVVMFPVIHLLLDVDEVTLERSARGFILALIGSFLFADKKGVNVPMCFLPLLRDLTHTTTYN